MQDQIRKLFLRTAAVACVGSSLLYGCGPSIEEQVKTFVLTPGQSGTFLTLFAQSAALAGRHAVMPTGLDLAAPPTECPGEEGRTDITVGVAGCLGAGGALQSCQLLESYNCLIVQGDIGGTIQTAPNALTVSVATTNYTEGDLDTLGLALHYNGPLTVHTSAAGAAVTLDSNFVVETKGDDGVVSAQKIVLNSAYTILPTEDRETLLYSGNLTIDAGATGIILMALEEVEIETDPEGCATPSSGSIDMNFAGVDKARLIFDSCGRAHIEYRNVHTEEVYEDFDAAFPEQDLEAIFATGIADMRAFKNSPRNMFAARSALRSSGNTYWCKLIGDAAEIENPFFSFDVTLPVPEAPVLAECMIMVFDPIVPEEILVSGVVAFIKGFDDIDGGKNAQVLSAEVYSRKGDDTEMEITHLATGDAYLIGHLGNLTGAVTQWVGLRENSPYWTATTPVTRKASVELNHFGTWLQDGEKQGQFFAVDGVDDILE